MKKEVYEHVIDELVTEVKQSMPSLPVTLKEHFGKPGGIALGAVGGTGGAFIGTHLGIAGFFGAISGMLPLMIGLGTIGYLVGQNIGEQVERTTDQDCDPCSDES